MANKNDIMTRARSNLVLGHPFFGSLALRLRMVAVKDDPNIDTACTDGRSIFYNEDWVNTLSVAKATALLAHECMHPAMLHQTRRGSRHPKKWNVACDHAINNILVEAGFDLPDGGCADPQYKGKSAEEVYALLPDPPGGWDNQSNDPGGCGGVMDAPGSGKDGPSNSELAEAEADWKIALTQAAHMAKQAGKLPAGMERLIDATLEAKIPWRQLLQQFFNDPQPADVSWKRPNRRFVWQGLYLPSRDVTMSGEIVVAIDTSGSIGAKELNEFGSEIKGIVDQMRPSKTTVIYCDSAIAHVDEFLAGDELSFGAHGGGGTDFRPPFEYLAERDITPKAFVYLTDGYGPFPEEQDYPVLWCINNNQVTPPHGQHLFLDV